MTDLELVRRAIHLAQEKMEANLGGPFGAVIARDGQVIATGWNCVTSTNDPTAHAEVVAIRNACAQLGHFALTDCVIYCSCEPCPMCLAAIYWARIERIVYAANADDAAAAGFDDRKFYQELCAPAEQRSLTSQQLAQHEAQLVFQAWASKSDRVDY